MDYNEGNQLVKYQWDVMHDPQKMLFKWLQDESEGAISNFSSNQILITQEVNLLLKPNDISINYRLDKWQEKMKELHNIEAAGLSDYKLLLLVEYDKKIVYDYSNDLNEKGNIKWHGLVYQGDIPLTSKNRNDFKLHLGIIKKSNTDQKFKHWNVAIGAHPETSIIYPDGDRNSSISFFDLKEDIQFEYNIAWEEWTLNEDMQDWVYPKTLENYSHYRDIYMSYNGVKNSGNPFNYIKENTTRIDFFGKKVLVHNEFAKVLEIVKCKLQAKGIYDNLSLKYQNQMGTLSMRTMNDPKGGGKVSEHGFGLAIDFYISKNPQILRSNSYVRFFIKKSTGLDIGESKTVNQIKDAHNKFISIYQNITLDDLVEKYNAIKVYNGQPDNIKINSLMNIKDTLSEIYQLCETGYDKNLLNEKIINYKGKIENLTKLIPAYKNSILFSASSNEQIDGLIIYLEQVNSWLMTVKNYIKNNNLNLIDDYPIIRFDDYRAIQVELDNFYDDMKNLCSNLSEFAENLYNGINAIGYGNVLLKDGFCDIELDLVHAFREADERIQWGGTFSLKVDAMHFGFTSAAAAEIVNKN